MKIIEIKKLKKNYGDVKAVKGIDFYVEKGQIFSLLGPNGAGKSTTIDMMCTLLKPDEGSIVIDGYEVDKEDSKIREEIGVVFQDNLLDPLLTIKENLMIRASFYKNDKSKRKQMVKKALEITNIYDIRNRKYGKLSGGQRRRADIARALVNQPKILFLDEPTTGLDPETRKNVWDTIRKMQHENGMTVILTTHYMEEAATSDYVVVMNQGKISAKGTPEQLRKDYSSDLLKITTDNIEEVTKILKTENIQYTLKGKTIIISLNNTLESLSIIEKCKTSIVNFEVINGTMDDAFIAITREGVM